MSEVRKLVEKIKSQIPQLEPDAFANQKIVLLDCRDKEEVELGVIPNSLWIEKGKVDLQVEEKIPNKEEAIVVYCASGYRSALVAKTLVDLGYKKVSCLNGGITNWKNKGLPIEAFKSQDQINKRRYLSQLRVPEIGEAGQQLIQNAKVLIIGAGGLGSPISYYLAAAGVGTIGLVDSDVVDESNLQRQILHTTDRIGVKKVDSAYLTLKALNPKLNLITYPERLEEKNVDRLMKDYDIIVDGCDNFATRYLVNMASVKNKKLNVHGSVLRFQGQVSVFGIENGPCYSCIFPLPPTGELEMDCAEGGVLGATVGVVGTLMAVEVVKLILKKGRPLSGKLLAFDGLHGEFDTLKVSKNPDCEICSKNASQLDYKDLSQITQNCKVG